MRYVLDFDEQEYLIEDLEDLARHLKTARQRDYADLQLAQKIDVTPTRFEKFVYGSLGLRIPNEGKSLSILLNNILAKAFVIFVADEDTSFHSCNPNYEGNDEKIYFYFGTGERDENLASECVTIDEAISEMFYFFENNEKSEQICWLKD